MNVNQVLDRLVDDVESVAHDLHSQLASAGYRHGVGIDGLETLLEDGFLTASWRDLLLPLVTIEVLLQHWVNHEARSIQAQKQHKQKVNYVTPIAGRKSNVMNFNQIKSNT